MTQEEKQLLLQDLCARLPYGVRYKNAQGYKDILDIFSPGFHTALYTILYDGRPSLYLRQMSSMTEEEVNEYNIAVDKDVEPERIVDWYYVHHLDFRRLIEKGLALEAPEGMYK